ncbi:bromodomain-containing protein 8-like isoform X2 [Mya arenaria]|uniref:bromodomain-containing protein 8-like isoform X2 n=1 Tax=Mya arenaria TaxID=6604 RepID=UPI0022E7C836|nr:bromodomain-containing protein 8-like isoform X2 [Mya arenaria]XP_052772908.1 bromodomain-containing protein 8-like isoform X2 [Mya arenaria]
MAAPAGYRLPKRPLDKWSIRERLALASSVRLSGDQNWVSVSRAIKSFGESTRPQDWFSQKNCAMQYADLLEKVETPKRKRGEKGEREVVETPAVMIVRRLTIERIEELKQTVQQEQSKFRQLKREIEALKTGRYDDQLDEMWERMQAEKEAAEARRQAEERRLAEEAAERARVHAARRGLSRTTSSVSTMSEVDESTQDSIPDTLNVETTDDELPATPGGAPVAGEVVSGGVGGEWSAQPTSSASILSQMISSEKVSVDHLQQLKNDAEAEHAQRQTQQAANQIEPLIQSTNEEPEIMVTSVETTEVFEEEVDEECPVKNEPMDPNVTGVKLEDEVVHTDTSHVIHPDTGVPEIEIDTSHIKEEIVECDPMVVEETVEVMTHVSPIKTPAVIPDTEAKITMPKLEMGVVEEVTSTTMGTGEEVGVEDDIPLAEPVSPASSISSRISDTGSRSSQRRGKGRSSSARRGSFRSTRKSNTTDDLSSRPSDAETSDDDGDSSVTNMPPAGSAAFSESIPNSPHSSHCSDTEDDKAYKAWKKSIMLVWRGIANHKYASVFLHPVKDDFAPGYSLVVKRPKDLTQIKRHIESGTIRTTSEFQRDMMLMFTNAIMYNNANHDVNRMATEMYNDVLEQIEQYVSTQMMLQNTEAKLLRPSRRNESSDKEEESRRRRTSSEAEGGKAKKRKSRTDET